MIPLTDDDLGARLRAALQELSPLASDPVPGPPFVTDLVEPGTGARAAEVVVLGAAPGRRGHVRRRVAVGVTFLAAVAAVVVVALAVLGGSPTASRPAGGGGGTPSGDPAPGASSGTTRAVPDPHATVPDRGGATLGVVTDPQPWRCTAPAGTVLSADIDPGQVTPTVWRIGAGASCAPTDDPADTVVFSSDGRIAYFGGAAGGGSGGSTEGPFCTYIATGALGVPLSFVSLGPSSYIEFHGPGCRLVLPTR